MTDLGGLEHAAPLASTLLPARRNDLFNLFNLIYYLFIILSLCLLASEEAWEPGEAAVTLPGVGAQVAEMWILVNKQSMIISAGVT